VSVALAEIFGYEQLEKAYTVREQLGHLLGCISPASCQHGTLSSPSRQRTRIGGFGRCPCCIQWLVFTINNFGIHEVSGERLGLSRVIRKSYSTSLMSVAGSEDWAGYTTNPPTPCALLLPSSPVDLYTSIPPFFSLHSFYPISKL
jgi:hypothetical protein